MSLTRRASRLLVTAAALGVLSACATPQYIPLKEGAEATIETSAVVVIRMQRELGWSYIPSNTADAAGASGGLLGSLIGGIVDSIANSKREAAAVENSASVRAQFDDAKLHDMVKERARAILARAAWLKAVELSFAEPFDYARTEYRVNGAPTNSDETATIRRFVDAMDADARGVMKVTYWLNPNLSGIEFHAELAVYPEPDDETTGLPTPIYKATENFRFGLSGARTDASENASLWGADRGAAIADAINVGGGGVLDRLAEEISNPRRDRP